jgi:hypothetical protein
MMKKNAPRYIKPPNYLKQKVGTGGLPKEVLDRADNLVANNDIDFSIHTKTLLDLIKAIIEKALESDFRTHDHVTTMIYPVMQLKAHGGMFGQPLISEISASALSFLENIYVLDNDAIRVLQAHQNALQPILESRIYGLGGPAGKKLVDELRSLCTRYYKKHKILPEN